MIIQQAGRINEKYFIPIAVAVIGSLIAAYISQVSPKIGSSTADQFFSSYFRGVAQASQRQEIYNQDLTPDLRSFDGWSSFKRFWGAENYVIPSQAIPVSSPELEFEVTLSFYTVAGESWQATIDYYLACKGLIGRIWARLDGCPTYDIEIDRTVWLNPPV